MPCSRSPSGTLADEGDASAGLVLRSPTVEEAPVLTPQSSDRVLLGDLVQTPQHSGHAVAATLPRVEAIQQCRIPAFWKANPELWFFQVESIFQTHQVRSDDGKYHLVVGALTAEALQDVADVLKNPPPRDKYKYIKAHIMSRMAETADRRLQRVLNELELGDKKPSQLLRQMRTLAEDTASEDVLRIKWLDLLPPSTQRLLKIFRATRLDELAKAADELMEGPSTPGPAVMATTTGARRTSPARYAPDAQRVDASAFGDDLSDIRRSLGELISINRDLLSHNRELTALTRGLYNRPARRDSWQQPRGRSRPRTPSPAKGSVCRFHKKYGADAYRCTPPCSFGTTGAAAASLPKN